MYQSQKTGLGLGHTSGVGLLLRLLPEVFFGGFGCLFCPRIETLLSMLVEVSAY